MPLDLGSIVSSFRKFQLLYTALRLELPQMLGRKPHSLDQLVQTIPIPPERMIRLLRGLIWAEVVLHKPEGFCLTKEAEPLLNPSPVGIAGDILFQGDFFFRAWGELHQYFATGMEPFALAHKNPVFHIIQDSPRLSELFNSAMSLRTREYSEAIAALSAVRDAATIVDIGGGEGQLLVDLLEANTNQQGIIFDLPSCAQGAEQLIASRDLASRCRFVAGDMFNYVPESADLYILKWILHDWNDHNAGKTLHTIAAAMSTRSSLLVIERLMPEEITAGAALAQADLNMLCLNGGAERTPRQYRELFSNAGITLQEILPIEEKYGLHGIVGRRAVLCK